MYQGVYFLDVKESCRKVLILRGFISLAGMIMLYQSMQQMGDVLAQLNVQYGAFGVTYFFMMTPEER